MTDGRLARWRRALYAVIFESDTSAGRRFDIALLLLIVASVAAVVLESVPSFQERWGDGLRVFEWVITVLFTLEYVVRLLIVPRPVVYARSFFGVVDLLALLPTFLSLVFVGTQSLIVIRALRLVRAFRILKLTRYAGEASELWQALRASRHKISAFLLTMATVIVVVGALLYVVEGPQNEDFSSIPASMYFTVVTVTTLGFGDITPQTGFGRFLTAAVSLLGYGVLAVPTGIVSAEIASARATYRGGQCPQCGFVGHDLDASHCKMCGARLASDREALR